ncbi:MULTISPECIES: hypothetical protein [unclassified Nostoc]|uniref:hypothetical protein n=1 Tax=unclassified Nostoc TaxID=2593658 RepID=UPI001685F070|nr:MULTISPECIES: hypothetical protein [unclassified Nostoc]MBD2302541.1 hypothetical protein [Nostoc sp. FACHB-190]MBD2439107.1 hypothetical protein [Nostoc sp. FACHB-110]
MSDIAILKEMIQENATVPLQEHYDKKKVILTELTDPKYSVTIYGMPKDDEVIVIKADNFESPKTIFQGKRGECKRADFVIIADTEDKKVILYIEMKGGKGGSEIEIIQQLKGGECFIAYCQKIGQSFWNQQNFLSDYVYRFVSIKEISIAKQKTRISRQTNNHDRPDKMLKISSPNYLHFNHLIGG